MRKHKYWFDEQDTKACQLLDDMHRTNLAWININNRSHNAKKSPYMQVKRFAQTRLHEMKEKW
jgi:hypothetical protein